MAASILENRTTQNKGSERFRIIRETLSGGRWIMDNLTFFLFLSAIAVLYIANGHMADRTIRDINKTQKEIKDLQFEYKTVKSEVMYKSEVSQIQKAVAPLGLNISNDVPFRLHAEKK